MVPGQISTGNPQFLFRYDQHNKLVARIGAYNSKEVNAYENAWVYLYDQNNRIIRDTFYTQGFYNPAGYPIIKTGQPMTSTSYSYDNKNRIIQTVEKSLYMYSNRYRITRDYYYNADNNLWKVHQVYEDVTLPDSLCAPHCPPPYIEDFYREYDNKINFRTLNPVWQFIDKDYSKNNSFKVMGYDTYGLPLEIIQPEGVAVQSTLGITVYHSLIKYQYLR